MTNALRAADVRNSLADVSAAAFDLAYDPVIDFESGTAATLQSRG